MRVFLAGASGALGRVLVPRLVASGHQVVGTTRTASKVDELRRSGAEPVVVDALDREAVIQAVTAARPEVVVHQLTALAEMNSFRRIDDQLALTNRLRTEGTDHLLAGARAAGAGHFVAQSFIAFQNARVGSWIKTEEDPLDSNPPKGSEQTVDTIRRLERTTLQAPGLVGTALRYGGFYGPGTGLSVGGPMYEMVRQRKFPVVGNGAGVWSFLHVVDAATATLAAIEKRLGGLYNVVDDDPAPVATWLPELASAIGAPPPRHLPAWIGRLLLGEFGLSVMTQIRGSSNAKFKAAAGWAPTYASWREGFQHGLA